MTITVLKLPHASVSCFFCHGRFIGGVLIKRQVDVNVARAIGDDISLAACTACAIELRQAMRDDG